MSKTTITRRQFLIGTAATGVAMTLPLKFGVGSAWAVANSPQLAKWIQPMRQLDILTRAGIDNAFPIPTLTGEGDPLFTATNFYRVEASEFQDTLHPALGPTTLWGYSAPGGPKRHLGGVIVANRGTATRLRMKNALVNDYNNNPINQHIIPLDTSIPGAEVGVAPNRIAIHLHGGYIPWISDGGPFDWWLPNGTGGISFQNGPGSLFDNPAMDAGEADYFYPNDQSCRLMWYHDHAFGITRINAYAGLATGYLILDNVNAGYYTPASGFPNGKIPPLASTFPLVFQDKIFVSANTQVTDPTWFTIMPTRVRAPGSLWYDHIYDPKVFRLLKSKKYLPTPNPSAIPEFFGDTMLANGLVYPTVTVEAKRYRFMILNACNARFFNINLLQVAAGADVTTNPKTGLPAAGTALGPPMIQIGNEAGFLVMEVTHPNGLYFNPATLTGNLLLAPAERADIIIDFTGKGGQEFMMYNDAPGPFPAGPPTTDYYLGNPKNPIQPAAGTGPDTRNILRFKVVAGASDPQPAGAILDPTLIDPPLLAQYTNGTTAPIPPLTPPAGTTSYDFTLNEDFDQYGRLRQMMGTTAPALVGKGFGLEYLVAPTIGERPQAGQTVVWRVFNLTADTHPIHFHLVNVQVLSRQPFKVVAGVFTPTGAARGPEPNEVGWKETVQMHPGEVTSVVMKFDLPEVPFSVPASARATAQLIPNSGIYGMGLPAGTIYNEYVYHCHILEHEEHDMMRPLVVEGQNPWVQEAAPGGVATFRIEFGPSPYGVSADNQTFPAPSPIIGNTFTITVPATANLGDLYTYTVTAGSSPSYKATVRVI